MRNWRVQYEPDFLLNWREHLLAGLQGRLRNPHLYLIKKLWGTWFKFLLSIVGEWKLLVGKEVCESLSKFWRRGWEIFVRRSISSFWRSNWKRLINWKRLFGDGDSLVAGGVALERKRKKRLRLRSECRRDPVTFEPWLQKRILSGQDMRGWHLFLESQCHQNGELTLHF